MAKNSLNKKEKAAAVGKAKEKEKLTRKQIIILIAVSLVAVMVSLIIIGSVLYMRSDKSPDLLKADLSKYITLSGEDYKNIDLNIPLEDESDEAVMSEVERRIRILLTDYKTLNEDDPENKGAFNSQKPLSLGDEVKIYYRGYTIDENGRQKEFAGSSNFASDTLEIIEVGTGKIFDENGSITSYFISGFGEGLEGKVPWDYYSLKKITGGNVAAGDVIYLSYTVIGENGNKTVQNERIDLSLDYIDEIYGDGFSSYFVEKAIGEKIESATFKIDGHVTETVYSDMKISFVTRGSEDKPITVKVKFPASYQEESLRGVEAYFDVFVDSGTAYDAPEFDDKFVTESLKIRADRLDSYEGDSLADKYKSMLYTQTKADIEDANVQLLSNKICLRSQGYRPCRCLRVKGGRCCLSLKYR